MTSQLASQIATPGPSQCSTVPEDPLINWQKQFKTWTEKIEFIYKNSSLSDFKFIVGEEKQVFHAHKFIFALTSPEFVNIFYLLKVDMTEIVLPDNNPTVFKHFMDFVYTGDCYMDVQTVPELLKLAKLYSVPLLTDKCDNLLKDWVDQSDIWKIIDYTNDFELPKCEFKCLRLISKHFNQVLQEDGFTSIHKDSLKKIVEYEMMSCKEFDLFKAVDYWSDVACDTNKLEKTPINKRNLLGDLVSKIRFATMDFDEFRMCSTGNGFLTNLEILEIVKGVPSSSMSIVKRMGQLPMFRCLRFPDESSNRNFKLIGKTDFNVTVNKPINLFGYGIFGKISAPGYETYGTWDVKFGLSYEGRILFDNYEYVSLYNSRDAHELYFKSPIKLEALKTYNVWVEITGLSEMEPNLIENPRKGTAKAEINTKGVVFNITDSINAENDNLETSEQGPIAFLIFST